MKRIVWAAVVAALFSLFCVVAAARGMDQWVLATGLVAITYAILATRD